MVHEAPGDEIRPGSHIRKGDVGDWRNYFTKRDGEIFLSETTDYLVKMGYEKDDKWLDSLPSNLAPVLPRINRRGIVASILNNLSYLTKKYDETKQQHNK
jgi:hypothetical protein